MWFALAILGLIIIAVLVLPLGAGVKSSANGRKWYIIIAALRLPLPDKLLGRLAGRVRRTASETTVETTSAEPRRKITLHDLRRAWGKAVWFLRAIHIRVRKLHLTVASPDPALTGFAYGMASAVQGIVPSRWPFSFDVDFLRSTPKLDYHVKITVIPIRLMGRAVSQFIKRRQSE